MPAGSDLHAVVLAALFDHPHTLELLSRSETVTSEIIEQSVYWAASRGNYRCIDVLLKLSSKHSLASGRYKALAVAIKGGHVDSSLRLIIAGFGDPLPSVPSCGSPLMLAAEHGQIDVLQALMNRFCTLVDESNDLSETALMKASAGGFLPCVEAIVNDWRPDLNKVDKKGRSCLHHAAAAGSTRVLKFLLSVSGLDRGLLDIKGRNAISIAAQNGDLSTVKRLLHAGVSAAVPDLDGRNAISWAANSTKAMLSSGDDQDCVLSYLIEKYPDIVDTKDIDGWSPLAWALDTPGYLKALQILIKRGGANVNQSSSPSQCSIFLWALGMNDILRYILTRKELDLNRAGKDGRTFFSIIAERCDLAIVRLCLSHGGAAVTSKDHDGRSPADWAHLANNHAVANELDNHAKSL